MVSVSVLSILVLMFSSLFSSASRAWITGTGNVERRRNVRALTDYIGNELKAAMLPVQTFNVPTGGNQTTGNQTTGNLQFIVDPPTSQVGEAYQNSDSVFWQAPLATESTYGDIAEIGYFVKWLDVDKQQVNGTVIKDKVPMLCRFFINPSTTDPNGGGGLILNPDYLIFDEQDPNKWLSDALIAKVAPADTDNGYKGLFCENVVGLWIRCYGLDGQELPRNFDSRKGYQCKMQSTDAGGQSADHVQNWTETRYLPAKIVVSIAQVDSRYGPLVSNAATALQSITGNSSIRDAAGFLQAFRQQALTTPVLKPLLPGLRIYSTEVLLTNAQ